MEGLKFEDLFYRTLVCDGSIYLSASDKFVQDHETELTVGREAKLEGYMLKAMTRARCRHTYFPHYFATVSCTP